MSQVKLSITEQYVSHWSWWQGVRELLQNAVDTKDYDVSFGKNEIVIISRGGKVPTNALLLGKTTKAEDKSTIGKFGEGMKLGFLVLKRLGAGISMMNADDLWVPEIVFDETYGENVLAVNITPGFSPTHGEVQIVVSNIPSEAVEEIKSKFAPAQDRKVIIENYRGKAYSKDGDHKNCRLFINGIFVTEVKGKFKFDYDFIPSAFVLDRDRDSASTFEVKYEAAELIRLSDDVLLLAELATEYYDDLAEFRGSFKGWTTRRGISQEEETYGHSLAEKAAMVFREKNGNAAFPINSSWEAKKKRVVSQQVVKAGYTPIEVNNALFTMVESEYTAVEGTIEDILDFKPLDFLEKFLKKHSRKMYSKARRELENTIGLLKIAKGD